MSLVAFIIGAGPHVGAAVGAILKQNGYRIALGSRNPKIDETEAGFYPVKVDASSSESIQAAFQAVNAELGPPNVVIYNGTVLISNPLYIYLTSNVHQRHRLTLYQPPKTRFLSL